MFGRFLSADSSAASEKIPERAAIKMDREFFRTWGRLPKQDEMLVNNRHMNTINLNDKKKCVNSLTLEMT